MIITPQDPKFPLLHAKTQQVQFPLSGEDLKNIDLMKEELMKLGDGAVGLSANQIGLVKNIFIIKDKNKIRVFINTEILGFSNKKRTSVEGCLSLPGVVIKTKYPHSITIKYFDPEGKDHIESFESKMAQIICHEINHCAGKLIIKYFNDAQNKEPKRTKFGMKLTKQKIKQIEKRRSR